MIEGAHAPVRVAITGGLGCGKSAAAAVLRAGGVPVLDVDDVARSLTADGAPLVHAIGSAFGAGVLRSEGVLDRTRLADLVFSDPQALARLNAIAHPPIREHMRRWIAAQDVPCAVVVPLLFESAIEKGWDAIICIACDEAMADARLAARGMAAGDARKRRAAQWPLEQKIARSDYTIWNNGAQDELAPKIKEVWAIILERSTCHGGRK